MMPTQELQLDNNKEASESLLNHFLDISLFPENFTQAIVEYIKCVPLDSSTKQSIINKCYSYLAESQEACPALTQRATQVKQILCFYEKTKSTELSNLIISEINITDKPQNNSRNQKNDNSLANLIIEEVDVADYI